MNWRYVDLVPRKARPPQQKVCLISGHPLVLGNFQKTIAREPLEVHPLLLESTFAASLRKIAVPDVPVFVVDANLPAPAMESLISGILERLPMARVIAVAENFSEKSSIALLRIGVKGLLGYQLVTTELGRAILMVGSGGYWVPREILARFLDVILQGPQGQRLRAAGSREMTAREQQILDYLLENLANKEIADKLNISERTVKFHVSNLLAKYKVQRRADLILLCYQRKDQAA